MTEDLLLEEEQNLECARLMEKHLDEKPARLMDEASSKQFPKGDQKASIRIVHMAPKRHMERVA